MSFDDPSHAAGPAACCRFFAAAMCLMRWRATVPAAMRPVRDPGRRLSVLGLLMAVLALLGQIAFGSAMPAQAAAQVPNLLASPLGDIPICHSGAPGMADDGAPVDHAHHGMQCALCPACHVLAAAAVLPVLTSAVPAPLATLAARQELPPPARGPPAAAVLAATYPTGPPCLA